MSAGGWFTDALRTTVGYCASRITDNGTGAGNANGRRSGHGLIGIRERVAVAAGSVDVGQVETGGFVIRVQLPYAVVA